MAAVMRTDRKGSSRHGAGAFPVAVTTTITTTITVIIMVVAVMLLAALPLRAQVVAREGKGFLEVLDGYPILHLKGTPREMGYQHGVLFREQVRENLRHLLEEKGKDFKVEVLGKELGGRDVISAIFSAQRTYIPKRFIEEMEGLAAGAGVPAADIFAANEIPELFHCSGFAVMNGATRGGTLYHGRVLDYATDWRLQERCVLLVQEPDGRAPFVNVSYAGFIGSVTGMNAEQVAIGEMGGGGVGFWAGVPMSFLVRRVLEEAKTIDDAIAIFRDNPRTCQYYYVISDAKTNRAVGMEASWNQFTLVWPGTSHPLLPDAVKDAVILSAGDRYKELVKRVRASWGEIDAGAAIRLMDRPVAMKSNLHNTLFEPKTGTLWVANASKDGKPAATQKYHRFDLQDLLAARKRVARGNP